MLELGPIKLTLMTQQTGSQHGKIEKRLFLQIAGVITMRAE